LAEIYVTKFATKLYAMRDLFVEDRSSFKMRFNFLPVQ